MPPACPRCARPLLARRSGLHRCEEGGAFVEREALARLVPFAALAAYTAAAEASAPGATACPACRTAMRTLHVARHDRHVELDACPACEGTWFDAGEMERLTAPSPGLPRASATGHALHGGAASAAFFDPGMIAGLLDLVTDLLD